MRESTETTKLGWRLRIRMAENDIASAVELQERLAAVGYDISSAQLSRIVDKRPEQIKTGLLAALLAVLGGTLDDLMPTIQTPAAIPDAAGGSPFSTPRVEAVINSVMERFPGMGPAAQLRYFEAVHQHLAPLARDLERESTVQRTALENIRLLAARHRNEEWGKHVLRFCAEADIQGSPLRSSRTDK